MTTETSTNPEIYELGEDGDSWIVLTADPMEAEKRVRSWWEQNLDALDREDQYGEVTSGDFRFTYRDNWAWKPIDPDVPDDEAYLVRDAEGDGLERFAGTLVTL